EIVKKDPTRKITVSLKGLLSRWKRCKYIIDSQYRRLSCNDGSFARGYALPKVHKPYFQFRIIVSFIGSPLYSLASYLHGILFETVPKADSYIVNSARKISKSNEIRNSDEHTDSNASHSTVADKSEQEEKSRVEELEELLNGIKERFHSLPENDPERLRILTIAPLSWSIRKVATEFKTSRQMAQNARKIREERGILASATSKSGKKLPSETIKKVEAFYKSDENSRIMAGRKDTVTITVNNEKIKLQKRLILFNLKDLHEQYTKENIGFEVGFSKFASLRPKECVFAGASGTHCVCVCTTHENCKLLLNAINLPKLSQNLESPFNNLKDCMGAVMCTDPSPACYLNECDQCPTESTFSDTVLCLLEAAIEDVVFSAWKTTDRATLRIETLSSNNFVDELCDQVQQLKPHHFIAEQQSKYALEVREKLCEGEVIVHMDFSENYAFVVQNAVQAFHYNNNQCTLHPVVFYYRKDKEIFHKSLIFLSDCLSHDTVAVYVIQKLCHSIHTICVRCEKNNLFH
ncbi:hypothetical protein ALC57_11380, partial [Trachymyrmex cornetzi]